MPETTPSPPGSTDDPRDHPAQIGPYRILQVLGEGGMGVVYEAEQIEPVRRRVALKVMKLGMDTKEVVGRFEAERQALAVMDHPGIARVLDAGASDTGRPFFAMELVRGVPITDYCDTRRLTTRDRLELFLPVCHAIQHAHQKGVIHRDLKPSNVLITEVDGRPAAKVIDFGIAKAIGRHLTDKTLVTAYGQAMGTPAYMSPEQAEMSGLDVDTRTDIYSLGILLYELLVGTPPLDPLEVGLGTFIAQLVLRETDPPTPSTKVAALAARAKHLSANRGADPETLRRQMRGDLDWIVMKAIDKDRARRYETANGLARDIDRYLHDEPVVARPPSTRYRLGKFVKRHRGGVVVAGIFALAILVSSGVIAYLAVAATRARNVADQRRVQAEDLITFMVGDLRQQLEPIGRLEILDTVAQKALEYFAAVGENELTDEELFRRSETLNQLGQVRLAQGNQDAALDAFRESLRLSLALAERDPENGEWQVGLGASRFYVGYLHYLREDLDSALRHMEAYHAIAQRLVERDPANMDWQMELGYANSNIGSIQEARGDLRAALVAYRGTLATKRLVTDRDPADPDKQFDLANGYNKVAVVLQRAGNLDSALEYYRAEEAVRQALFRRDSTNANWLEFQSINHNYLAGLLDDLGDLEGARREYEADLVIARALVARDSANANWQSGLGLSELGLGRVLTQLGDPTGAMALLAEGHGRFARLAGLDPANGTLQRRLASAETAIGAAQLAAGRPGSARTHGERAIELLIPLIDTTAEGGPGAALGLANARLLVGRADAALGSLPQARQSWVSAVDLVEPRARKSGETAYLALLASALMELDRTVEARPIVDSLTADGFARVDFVALARDKKLLR